jgi:hypothetical protein
MNYKGYLLPHMPRIIKLVGDGVSIQETARILYADGVRGPFANWHGPDPKSLLVAAIAGNIRHALGLTKKPTKKPKWIVWTPELQAAELASERANG